MVDEGDEQKPDLDDLRQQIDLLDAEIISALNRRAEVVVQIGEHKRGSGGPIYAPDREAKVLEKVLGASRGPLQPRTIEAIYRELMSGSFSLERPLRIGFLGPAGSHSHQAALAHFGASVDYEDLREIAGVFTEVRRGHVDYGLVPIENSIGGGILETLDAFFANSGRGVHAYAEVQMSIRHNLLANCKPSEVRCIYSKPEVFAQCRSWIRTQYPHAEEIPAASSSRAAMMAFEELRKDPKCGAAAIGSRVAGQRYGLEVLFESIEDDPNNVTRFLVISSSTTRPSGNDKTSLMFSTDKGPGTLVAVLNVFRDAGVNLTHIDKRPSGKEQWSYTFFVDAAGHVEDPEFERVLESARVECRELVVLGSYPASRRVL